MSLPIVYTNKQKSLGVFSDNEKVKVNRHAYLDGAAGEWTGPNVFFRRLTIQQSSLQTGSGR